MHANFGEDWLRGFGLARGRILAFSIDLLRRLYSTLALPVPSECLIWIQSSRDTSVALAVYTASHKKQDTIGLLVSITSRNIDQFSKSFHCKTQLKIF